VPRTASTYFIELKMTETVGDFFVEPLHQWGVRRIYGYPGDSINGVFGALQRAEGVRILLPPPGESSANLSSGWESDPMSGVFCP